MAFLISYCLGSLAGSLLGCYLGRLWAGGRLPPWRPSRRRQRAALARWDRALAAVQPDDWYGATLPPPDEPEAPWEPRVACRQLVIAASVRQSYDQAERHALEQLRQAAARSREAAA